MHLLQACAAYSFEEEAQYIKPTQIRESVKMQVSHCRCCADQLGKQFEFESYIRLQAKIL